MALLDCEARHNGTDAVSENGSSLHGAVVASTPGHVLRVNGSHHHNYGKQLNDVYVCRSWNLGLYLHDTGAGASINFELDNGKMWLDTCQSEDATTDIHVDGSSQCYKRGCIDGGNYTVVAGSTLEDY